MRSLIFFFGIFAFVGTITLVLGLFFSYQTVTQISTWQEAPATLKGFSDSNTPIIEFNYNGNIQQFYSSYSSSDMKAGDVMKVHFPQGHPDQAEIKNFFSLWFLPLFMSVFALTFGGVGYYGVVRQIKKLGMKRELFDNQGGKRLNLPITAITQDMSYRVNGRSPYIIVCQWLNPLTNMMHEFKSDYLWYHPGTVLGDRKTIDVYIDENDPTRYYVDITFLPKKA